MTYYDEKVPLRHVLCGGIGFYVRRRLELGEEIRASDFELLDGSQPVAGEPVECGACGATSSWGVNTIGPKGEFRPDEGA